MGVGIEGENLFAFVLIRRLEDEDDGDDDDDEERRRGGKEQTCWGCIEGFQGFGLWGWI